MNRAGIADRQHARAATLRARMKCQRRHQLLGPVRVKLCHPSNVRMTAALPQQTESLCRPSLQDRMPPSCLCLANFSLGPIPVISQMSRLYPCAQKERPPRGGLSNSDQLL